VYLFGGSEFTVGRCRLILNWTNHRPEQKKILKIGDRRLVNNGYNNLRSYTMDGAITIYCR